MGKMWSYNDELHEYRIDELVVPSVTQVLADNRLTNFSTVSGQILERSMNFGTAFHKLTELDDCEKLNEEVYFAIGANASLRPLLESWRKFKRDYEVEIITVEYRNVSHKFRFGFTLDRVIVMNNAPNKAWNGKRFVLDIKTGVISPPAKYQLAAYQLGWEEHNPNLRISGRLAFKPKDSEAYVLKEFKDSFDWTDFLHLLSSTHIRRRM